MGEGGEIDFKDFLESEIDGTWDLSQAELSHIGRPRSASPGQEGHLWL